MLSHKHTHILSERVTRTYIKKKDNAHTSQREMKLLTRTPRKRKSERNTHTKKQTKNMFTQMSTKPRKK